MGGSRLTLIITLLALGGFTYFIVKWTNEVLTDVRAGASSTSTIEAEQGTPTGNVQIIMDDSVSNAKYVQFGSVEK
jgi:hypothetical protein